jgi:hypothetical protein
MFFQLHVLQDARFQLGGQHGVAVAQRDFGIGEGQVLVLGRDEVLALDHVQHLQHVHIQDVPWTDLLFDHVEAGLFDIHL